MQGLSWTKRRQNPTHSPAGLSPNQNSKTIVQKPQQVGGRPSLLTKEQESFLVAWILECDDVCKPQTKQQILNKVCLLRDQWIFISLGSRNPHH